MFWLLNFILMFIWTDGIASARENHSPSLADISELKQSYVAWPANTPLSLKCKAEGEPPLEISWYKNGKLVKFSENIFQDQKWNLKFRKPQLADNGVYTCVITNAYGSIKHSHNIRFLQRIQSPPILVPGYPKPITARVGDNVKLECLEKPNGQVSHYRWLKTDSLVKTNQISPYDKDNVNWLSPQKYKSFEVDGDDGTKLNGVMLELTHVTEEDKGYYTCFLSNSNGFTFNTTFLNVTPILPSDPPEFLIPKYRRRHFIASLEKEDVTFSCLVRGGAPLKYQWFHNERLLKSDEKHEIRESELIVRHIQLADNGVYSCRIKNDYGHVRHNFKLKVLVQEPSHPDHPQLLRGYPKSKKAVVGDSTSLYCADISDTLVDYRWLKWNKTVRSFTEADLLNGTLFTMLHSKHYGQPAYNERGVYLKLKNLTMADEGLYTCLAINMHIKFAYRSAFLTVEKPVKKNYDQQIAMAWLKERSTPKVETPAKAKVKITPKPTTSHCFNYKENLDEKELTEAKKQCETTTVCAMMFDDKTSELEMFCDERNLCPKYNITSNNCTKMTFGRVLCCCTGELCNQPTNKLFQKTKKTQEHSSQSRLTPVIFFSAFVLTISLMLALLGYRIRRRKAALKETIVHKTRPSTRKITKQKIMETRWLKEDI